MAIPIARMQACGRFHVPGVRESVTGYHVRNALSLLDPIQRVTVEGYLKTGCEGMPPPASTLKALRDAILETIRNAKAGRLQRLGGGGRRPVALVNLIRHENV